MKLSSKIEERIRQLKKQFWELKRRERENLSVCFLKCNLGVATPADSQTVLTFLKGFPLILEAGRLEGWMAFLHERAEIMPKDLPLPVNFSSLADYDAEDLETLKTLSPRNGLANYSSEDVETLADEVDKGRVRK